MTNDGILASLSMLSVILFALLLFVSRRADRRRKADYEQIQSWLSMYAPTAKEGGIQSQKDSARLKEPTSIRLRHAHASHPVEMRKHALPWLDGVDIRVKGHASEKIPCPDVVDLDPQYLNILEAMIESPPRSIRHEFQRKFKSVPDDWAPTWDRPNFAHTT